MDIERTILHWVTCRWHVPWIVRPLEFVQHWLVGAALLFLGAAIVALRDRHPRLLDEATPLSPGRRIVVVLLALVFLLTFVPRPFIFE